MGGIWANRIKTPHANAHLPIATSDTSTTRRATMRSNSDGRDFPPHTLFPVCTRQAQFVFTCRVIDSGKVSKFAGHTDAKKKRGSPHLSAREKTQILDRKG